jgi:hypothetical protein
MAVVLVRRGGRDTEMRREGATWPERQRLELQVCISGKAAESGRGGRTVF